MAFADLLAAADRAALGILGVAVRYASEVGVVANVVGVFDPEFRRQDTTQPGVVSVGPAVFVRLSDLPSDPVVDHPVVTVGGVEYRVREAQSDGQGGVVLHLIAR